MLIVAIAWIYVVGLMALTEPTVIAGIVTFIFYCVLPLATWIYIAGTGKRKARRKAAKQAATQAAQAAVREPAREATPSDQAGA